MFNSRVISVPLLPYLFLMEQGRPPVFKVLNAGFLVDHLLSSVGKCASHFVRDYPFTVPHLDICQKLYSLFFHAVLSFSTREGWIEVGFSLFWPLHLFSRESIHCWFRSQGIYWQLWTPQHFELSPVVSHFVLQSLFPAVAAIEWVRLF